MSIAEGLVILLVLGVGQAEICPLSCSCKLVETKGLKVDCSSRRLKEVPVLPYNTIKLYLQNNSLTTAPAGIFDHLLNLEVVDLSNNPWHCDCHILYLKLWMEDQTRSRHLAEDRCATPASAKMRPLSQLTGNELTGCAGPWPITCQEFLVRDIILIAFAIVVLVLMSCAVRISKRLACCIAVTEIPPAMQLIPKSIRKSHKSQ
ncbi:platelet glycoprotein IX [Microcaecilia unicolor]|uniref:Platelet glycoprotein IX n=1 Tax=Microcaecilia unicolor TaxID=1415580 RepID=A0A6P7YCX0_9AMPH|nr:platelet glycoprotein IX [Microcaecilia unicolor]